jgi:tRNA(Arg) A34 adenosine deaminase TadA
MSRAIEIAKTAKSLNEVPVAAIITDNNNNIVSYAHNLSERDNNCLCHAEVLAINAALKKLNLKRLEGFNIYVTLEPCLMCAGSISLARISKLIYGASDIKGGAIEHGPKVFDNYLLHKPEIISGLMQAECSAILKEFFENLR